MKGVQFRDPLSAALSSDHIAFHSLEQSNSVINKQPKNTTLLLQSQCLCFGTHYSILYAPLVFIAQLTTFAQTRHLKYKI
ncbi:hypothetical protein T12_9056 [Trichinella patagoniensis]|uniref:Uncharacterized protein n=1 Tax=Trichinella patagoniensis TaxID=990121 RepID=A0A0V1A9T1_9BILA|nr:hypothetical protein T12_9056 [Trichinella patagoniensis]